MTECTIRELKAIARDRKIKGYGQMRKVQLLEAIAQTEPTIPIVPIKVEYATQKKELPYLLVLIAKAIAGVIWLSRRVR